MHHPHAGIDAESEEYKMRIPKLLVLVTVYGMCAIGLVLLWNERRKNQPDRTIAEEATVPAYK